MNEKGYTIYIAESDLVRKYNTEKFQKREITIGSDGTDILIESNTISKVHLRISLRNDKLYFADNDSREGSFMYNNTEFSKLESMKYYKKEGQDTVIRLGTAALVIIASNKSESEYLKVNIEKGITIGRNRDSDIVLNHLGISQRHAQILPAEKGNIDMLYVYGNKRTFVNGQEIENEQVLRNCDYIQILNFTMIYFNSFIMYKKVFDGGNVEIHNLVRKSAFGRKTLDDVSLRINSNEFTAVIGGKNSGRKELINVMKGFGHDLKKGDVYFNGLDLLSNIDMLKEVIGYIPQESILYDSLTLKKCMCYAMRLKDYDDIKDKEFDRHIDNVLDILGIIAYSDMPVKELETDVRKRADIALELLGNPGLLIFDEPTLEFDDETEKGLLYMLRDISRSLSKTILISTNKIRRLEIFDKIIFMGAGGKICFCGTLDEAKMFFDTESITEIKNMLNENSDYWSKKYKNYFIFNITPHDKKKSKLKPKVSNKKQFATLIKRNFELLFRDRIKFIFILLQPIIFGILTYFIPSEYAKQTLFIISICAIWLGLFNSISEIYRERVIFKREHSGNLKIPIYLLSKYILQIIYALMQALIITVSLSVTTGFEGMKLMMLSDIFLDTFAVLFLIIILSASLGLLISSLLKRNSQIAFAMLLTFVAEGVFLWAILHFYADFVMITIPIVMIMNLLLNIITLNSLSKGNE